MRRLVGHAPLERHARDVVAGGVEGRERPQQRGGLFGLRGQFDEQGLFHIGSLPSLTADVIDSTACGRRIHPPLKRRGLPAPILVK